MPIRHATIRRTFWLTDVSAVPAAERRLARYALQLLQGAPDLKPRLRDRDFLGALWQLLQPVMHPHTVASFVTQPDEDEDDELADDWDAEPSQPQNDRHLRQRLQHCFQSFPRILLTRLEKADGTAPLSPTVDRKSVV